MMQEAAKASPQAKARIVGVLYLAGLGIAAAGETFLRGKAGFAAGYVAIALYVFMTVLVLEIFKPVNRSLAMAGAVFNFIGLAFEGLRWNPRGVDIALVFTGLFCLVIGYLTFRATFLPRIMGALMMVAGLGWVTYISPTLVDRLAPYNLVCGLAGEASLMLWLLVKGVNVGRWNEQARAMEGRSRVEHAGR
ncbi:MAG TPA: DUF4386 domain-containing protein [Candidatus Sulfotelmatobacter sp.]|nr:DUF4386 domain-containing protein [Candidatus Sulfotelmatobacter sp.]